MPRHKIYFRADGHTKMGLGHVIRSLALAEMLNEDFECHFIIRNPLETLKQQILEICDSIIELPDSKEDMEEVELLCQKYFTGTEIVVLDGYHFVTAYQQTIKNQGCKVVCIDDIHAYHFVADIVINHGGGVTKDDYSVETYTKLCLGLKYSLLREPFRVAATKRDYSGREFDSVFICLGGADPKNDTLKVLKKCIATNKFSKFYLVTGGAYIHGKVLNDYVSRSKLQIQVLSNLSPKQMIKYMKRCATAVTPPSTISYEYLSVGGLLYLHTIADNQKKIGNYFIKEKIAFPFSQINKTPNVMLNRSLKKQSVLFDGLIQKHLLKIFKKC